MPLTPGTRAAAAAGLRADFAEYVARWQEDERTQLHWDPWRNASVFLKSLKPDRITDLDPADLRTVIAQGSPDAKAAATVALASARQQAASYVMHEMSTVGSDAHRQENIARLLDDRNSLVREEAMGALGDGW